MARRRFQDPELEQVGGFWEIRVYLDEFTNGRRIRKRKRIRLAPISTTSVQQAKKLKDDFLRPINHGVVTPGSATPFEDFVKGVYLPTDLSLVARTTADRSTGIIDNYLIPAFGSRCLRDLTKLTLQKYILGFKLGSGEEPRGNVGSDATRRPLSRESVDKIRDVLSSIFASAVKYGYLSTNPMEGVQVPADKRGKRRHKPFIRPEQFSGLVELIPEPYATMVYVAVLTGLRVSELIGLRWGDIHEDSITIDERYCRGDWGEPKTEAANTTIPVNRKVIERIQRLRSLTVEVKAGRATRRYPAVRSGGPDDLVFQSVKFGRPMRDNNILVRHIKPAARKLGIPWVNWLVLRRSYSTWLRMIGTDPRDRQSLMRHARFSTTAEVYEQDLPESQFEAVEKLSALLK